MPRHGWMAPLALLFGCRAPPPTEPVPPPAHAVVVVIDALRADAVLRAHTPVLDELADQGASVERAWTAATWTVPSVISLFTGMSVRQHGADLGIGPMDAYPPLPATPTLAEVLRDAGFHTSGYYANSFLIPDVGFERGFERWRKTTDRRMAAELAEEVAGWAPGERHFVYLHLLGPHSPLRPSDEARERWGVAPEWFDERLGFTIGVAKRNRRPGAREAYQRAYLAVVEDSDARVGELLEALGPHRDQSVVVVTSDHGELLGEHDICGHGSWVWEELTRVPLIAVGAGELPPTLGTASVADLVTSSLGLTHSWPTSRAAALPLVSQREGKLAWSPDGVVKGIWADGLQVYDLSSDPGEARPLTGHDEVLLAGRERWEEQVPPGRVEDGRVLLHPDTRASLQALGYLDEVAR